MGCRSPTPAACGTLPERTDHRDHDDHHTDQPMQERDWFQPLPAPEPAIPPLHSRTAEGSGRERCQR